MATGWIADQTSKQKVRVFPIWSVTASDKDISNPPKQNKGSVA
jgi:hypothetical protein